MMSLWLIITQCQPNQKSEILPTTGSSHAEAVLNPAQLLGKKLFFDTLLSNPAGQSCASCHMPKMSFTDPEQLPVSRGAMKTIFGHRNSPTVAYAAFTPYFHYDSVEQGYIGGLFWDGRAATLEEQAKTPLLTQHEMNNADKSMVVECVMKSGYKDLFLSVYGQNVFDDKEKAFGYLAEAIEEYEETPEISPFSSKFDFYMRGQAVLSEEEMRGMQIFNDTLRAKCASCHPSTPDPYTNAVLFTDYTYDNLGIPANPELIKLDKAYTPDLGLGAIRKTIKRKRKI